MAMRKNTPLLHAPTLMNLKDMLGKEARHEGAHTFDSIL